MLHQQGGDHTEAEPQAVIWTNNHHAAKPKPTQTNLPKAQDQNQFLGKLGDRILHSKRSTLLEVFSIQLVVAHQSYYKGIDFVNLGT